MDIKVISTTEARKSFADLVNAAKYAGKRTKVTRRGKPMAAIVPIEDLERIRNLERERE